jgi:hypothetical protein
MIVLASAPVHDKGKSYNSGTFNRQRTIPRLCCSRDARLLTVIPDPRHKKNADSIGISRPRSTGRSLLGLLTRLSCACALLRAAERGVAGHCRPSGRRPYAPDWPTPRNPVVTPITVLRGHANDQLLDLSLDPRLPGLRRAVEPSNLRATSSVPGQDGVRPGYIRHLGENLAARSMTDLAKRGSPGVRELEPPLQLGIQDAIFSRQIFLPRQQLQVHYPRDVGEDARSIHSSSISRFAIDGPQKS